MKIKPPLIHTLIGWMSIITSIGVGTERLLNSPEEQHVPLLISMLLGIGFGILILLLLKRYTLDVEDYGLSQTSRTGEKKEINWDQIDKITYSKISRELTIYGTDVKIKTHSDMIGFDQLYVLLAKHTEITLPEINNKDFYDLS